MNYIKGVNIFILFWTLMLSRWMDCVNGIQFKCILNPFYQPICGSDHRTYGNMDLLNCHNRLNRLRRPFVRPVKHHECKTLVCPSKMDLNGEWIGSMPVCANNGFTYGDVHQVRCLKYHYPELKILHEGGCTLHDVRNALKISNIHPCHIERINFEVNPICGSNNITYANPFDLLCQNPNLHEKLGGTCNCPYQMSCQHSQELTKKLKFRNQQERKKNAVCGNDQRTYRSRDHLECARRYDMYLFMSYNGKCRRLNDPCPDKLKYINVMSPVCGSDNKSYTSYDALKCAQIRMSKNLKYRHAGACI